MSQSNVSIEDLVAHDAWIRDLVGRLIHDDNAVDDVVQDTWAKFLEHRPRVGQRFRYWLRRVAENVALVRIRDEARRTSRERASARAERLPSAAFAVERHERRTVLSKAVLALEEPYRSAILLRFFENRPPRVIASDLEIPVAAVKSRIRRGLEQLRARLDREFGGDRQAWCAALLPLATGLTGGVEAASATTVACSTILGAAVMSTKVKVVSAIAAVLVVGSAIGFVLTESAPPSEQPVEQAVDGAINSKHPLREKVTEGTTNISPAEVPTPAARHEAAKRQPGTDVPASGMQVVGRLVDARNGHPIAKGEVWLGFGNWHRLPSLPTGTSDDEGAFRIHIDSVRDQGFWSVFVEASGYAPHRGRVDRSRKPSSDAQPYDLGDLRIDRGTVVTGRVVRKADRAPVGDALLLWTDESPRSEGFLLGEAREAGRSHNDGSFLLRDRLPPIKGWGHTLFAVSPAGTGWTTIHVVRNRESLSNVEVTLHSPGRLVATIRDENDSPVCNAIVTAEPRFSPVRRSRRRHSFFAGKNPEISAIFTSTTDDHGQARFDRLPTGDEPVLYDVVARAKERRVGWKDDVLVSSGEESEVTVVLRGHSCSVTGVVSSKQGIAITGAVVKTTGGAAVAETDQQGRYELAAVDASAGSKTLEVIAPGFARMRRQVDVLPSARLEGIDFTLVRTAPVEGWVVDQHGTPVPGARVSITEEKELPRRNRHPDRHLRPPTRWDMRTGMDGRFSFRDATEGRWKLATDPPLPATDWEASLERYVDGGDRSVTVTLTRLPAGAAMVIARVVHARTGKPLDPSKAIFLRAWRERDLMTGGYANPIPELSAGQVAAKIKPGRWRIRVWVKDIGIAEHEFQVQETDSHVRLTIEVGEKGSILGRVVLKGVPATSVPKRLWIVTLPRGMGRWVREEDGRPDKRYSPGLVGVEPRSSAAFRLADVPSGIPITLKVGTSRGSMLIGSAVVVVPPGGEARVDLPVQLGGAIHFRTESVLPGARGQVEVSRDGQVWERHLIGKVVGGRLSCTVGVLPGLTHWKSQFFVGWTPEGKPRWANVHGKTTVPAGESVDVIVSIPK